MKNSELDTVVDKGLKRQVSQSSDKIGLF